MKSLLQYIIESKLEEINININSLINYINENNGIKLSNVLKNISKNKEFIKLLNEYGYEYTLDDYHSKEELIDGLCDYVCYFIYNAYGDKYKYYNLSDGTSAHWVIFDPNDKLYKDGYDYKGKSDYKDLKWYKNYIKNNISGYKIELSEEIPEIF